MCAAVFLFIHLAHDIDFSNGFVQFIDKFLAPE